MVRTTTPRAFADWLRAASITVSDDYIKRRWSGVETCLRSGSLPLLLDLVRIAADLPLSNPASREQFGAYFFKADRSFSAQQDPGELRALACATLLSALDVVDEQDRWKTDAAALAIVTADFHGRAEPMPVVSMVPVAADYLAERAVEERQRTIIEVTDFPRDELEAAATKVEAISGGDDVDATVNGLVNLVSKLTISVGRAFQQVEEATSILNRRQLVQDEEANIIWWVYAGRSRDRRCPLAQLPPVEACLVAAKELSDLTTLLPGPIAADAYLAQILESILPNAPATISIAQAANAADREWRRSSVGDRAINVPTGLAPLVLALTVSLTTDGAEDWLPAYQKVSAIGFQTALSPLELASQMYQECLLVRAASRMSGQP